MNTAPHHRRTRASAVRSGLGIAALVAFMVPPLALAGVNRDRPAQAGPPQLENAVMDAVQGKQIGRKTCEYTTTLELAPGEEAVEVDSLAFDDESCTMIVQRGTPTEAILEDDRAGAVEESSQEGGAAAVNGRGFPARSLARVAATHSAGYYKSYFEDPPGIDVNSVRNNVNWYWNGSYVYNGYCSYHYGWFSASGWGLHENNFFCRYENSQTQVRSSSYAHFKNGIFCAFIDTHTYYDRNNAYGRHNGYLAGQVTWRKSGGCTGLLSFHTRLVRTLN